MPSRLASTISTKSAGRLSYKIKSEFWLVPILANLSAQQFASRKQCLIQTWENRETSYLLPSKIGETILFEGEELAKASTTDLASNSTSTKERFWLRQIINSSTRFHILTKKLVVFLIFLENPMTQLSSSSRIIPPSLASPWFPSNEPFVLNFNHPALGMAIGQGGVKGWGLYPQPALFCLVTSHPRPT